MLGRRLAYAGIVGNGRTCALVDARGRIGWLCLPTFAQFPVFASLLDPVHGGRLEMGLRLDSQTYWCSEYGYFDQRYVPASNILVTTWMVAGWQVTLSDAMPWGENVLIRDIALTPLSPTLPASGPASPTCMVRLRPTAPAPPSAVFHLNGWGITIADSRCPARGRLVCRAREGEPISIQSGESQISLEFTPVEGRLTLILAYEDSRAASDRVMARWRERTGPAVLAQCQSADQAWLSGAVRLTLPDKDLETAFERSLLALRLLTYEPTGAMLAAATASLPSDPNGLHNWDYRYCWVRDGCYTAQALAQVGRLKEARRLYEFLLEREVNGQWPSPLWSIEPDYSTGEEAVEGLRGPGGETPVHIGNRAALQDQHDSPGNVLSGMYQYCLLSGTTGLAQQHWDRLSRAVEWCCDHWAEPEAGIWEKRDRNRLWVHGRALCWVAIRDGIRLARLLGQPEPPRWAHALDDISRDLIDTGWSEEKGAILRACESPSICDASVLALLLEGLADPASPRMRRTVDTLARTMAYGRAFRRDEDDVRFPFGLTTLWMVRALFRIGDPERAYDHLRAVLEGATDLDLMAEYFDPLSGRQWGNFPQAFSHEELIKAVVDMLWQWDGERLVLFPSLPPSWLAPGVTVAADHIPVGGQRASIALSLDQNTLRFAAQGVEASRIVVPPHYFALGYSILLNGVPQARPDRNEG